MQIHFNKEFYCSCATIIAESKEFENEDGVHFIRYKTEIDWVNLDLEGKSIQFTCLEVPICKKLLEIYFLNNRKSIKILYHGANLKKRMGKYAYEINLHKTNEIAFSQPPFIDVCGQRMIRLCSKVHLDKDELYCVLANSHFSRKEQHELCDTWGFLLDFILRFSS